MCEIRVFYYIFCIEVLHSQFRNIEHEFRTHEIKIDFSTDLEVFKRIRAHYQGTVYQMANLLNEIFGLSQVTGISFCFYIVLTEMNYLLVHYNDLSTVNTLGKFTNFFLFFPQYFNVKSYSA